MQSSEVRWDRLRSNADLWFPVADLADQTPSVLAQCGAQFLFRAEQNPRVSMTRADSREFLWYEELRWVSIVVVLVDVLVYFRQCASVVDYPTRGSCYQ